MYVKLIILVALAGFLSAQVPANETTTVSSTTTASTTSPSTTTTGATPTTQAACTTARPSRRPRPHGHKHHHHRQPPQRPIEIPGLPVVSGIVDAFRNAVESIIAGGGPGGRPGGRPPRSIQASSNGPISSSSQTPENGSYSYSYSFSDSSAEIPNLEDVMSEIPDSSDFSEEIPKIPNFESLPAIPGIPVFSGSVDAFRNAFESIIAGGGSGGRPGGRPPRSIQASSNGPISSSSQTPENGSYSYSYSFSDSSSESPNPEDLMSKIPDSSNSSAEIPKIPNLESLPAIPGLQDAMDQARNMVAKAINAKGDLVSGIQKAIMNAIASSDPATAIRKIISTILNAYVSVARNCPFLIIGGYVLREGLSLASTVTGVLANITGQVQDAM